MSDHKHDNRSAFGNTPVGDSMRAERDRSGAAYVHIECNKKGDTWWHQALHEIDTRALTAALADALGIEIHPAGTATTIAALREAAATEPPVTTVDVSAIPELAGLSADEVEAVRADLTWWSLPGDARRVAMSVRYGPQRLVGLDERGFDTLSTRGHEVLAALQAQAQPPAKPRRLRRPPVYADLTDAEIECLYHALARRAYPDWAQEAVAEIIQRRELMTADCQLTDDGWGDLTAIEHPEGREAVEAPEPAEPEPQWSEPIAEMSPVECSRIARLVGWELQLRSDFGIGGRRYWILATKAGPTQTSTIDFQSEEAAWHEGLQVVGNREHRYDSATDRVNLTGLKVAR